MASFSEWKDKLLIGLCSLLVAGACTWSGWVTARASDSLNREEVRELISVENPYLQDRKFLEAQIQQMNLVIKNNTEAINALRLELASNKK